MIYGIALRWFGKFLAVALVIGSCWYGVDTVAGAFRDRAALTAKLTTSEQQRIQLTAEREQARKDAADAIARANAEQMLLGQVQQAAHDRDTLNTKTLNASRGILADWKKNADEATQHCLGLVVPDSLPTPNHQAIPHP